MTEWLAVALATLGTVLTGLGVWIARSAAKAATEQVALQRELAQSAAQPYVWADVRSSPDHGWSLELVVGNSGPTVATDVRVTFDPPLPVSRVRDESAALTAAALDRLAAGLNSIGPSRQLVWTLGSGAELLASAEPQPRTVSILAVGPFGPVQPLTYVLDLSDFRESDDNPAGTLHLLTRAVEKGLKDLRQP